MALPARTLFKDGKISTFARETLLRSLKFTGFVNCSNVRKTNVWPDMDHPFMLAFAVNDQPCLTDSFWFICPQADFNVNRVGELRIDSNSAHVVTIEEAINDAWLLKTMTIGTSLDVSVAKKLVKSESIPIDEYWNDTLGLVSRKGYVVSSKRPPSDASLLKGMPDVGKASELKRRFTIEVSECDPFARATLDETRIVNKKGEDPLQVYRGPLLLIRKSLPTDRKKGSALLCTEDVVFNQSFYGYSAKGHANADLLIRYFHLFVHSQVWPYYLLCTSPSLGVERPVFLKSDFDACRIVPFENLNAAQHAQIGSLSKRLSAEDESVFDEIDKFFVRTFDLDDRDAEVISDTLTVRNPHDELGKRGSEPASLPEAQRFIKRIRELLRPFAKRIDVSLEVKFVDATDAVFPFVEIVDRASELSSSSVISESTLELASKTGASRIIHFDNGRLLIGLLNQYRYWTPSRARLLAADVLREYFSAFEGVQ